MKRLIETKSDGMLPSALQRRPRGATVHSHPWNEGPSGVAAVQQHRDLAWFRKFIRCWARHLLILPWRECSTDGWLDDALLLRTFYLTEKPANCFGSRSKLIVGFLG